MAASNATTDEVGMGEKSDATTGTIVSIWRCKGVKTVKRAKENDDTGKGEAVRETEVSVGASAGACCEEDELEADFSCSSSDRKLVLSMSSPELSTAQVGLGRAFANELAGSISVSAYWD